MHVWMGHSRSLTTVFSSIRTPVLEGNALGEGACPVQEVITSRKIQGLEIISAGVEALNT